MGDIERSEGNRSGARVEFVASLKIRERIVGEYGESPESLHNLCVALERVGIEDLAQGEREEALRLQKSALLIRERIVSQVGESPQHLRNVCVSLNKVGDIEWEIGSRESARNRYLKCFQISKQIVEQFGETSQSLRDVATSCKRIADSHLQPEGGLTKEDLMEAEEFLDESFTTWENIQQRWGLTPSYVEDKSACVLSVAMVLPMSGKIPAAIDRLESSQQDLQSIVDNGLSTQNTLQKIAATEQVLHRARQAACDLDSGDGE